MQQISDEPNTNVVLQQQQNKIVAMQQNSPKQQQDRFGHHKQRQLADRVEMRQQNSLARTSEPIKAHHNFATANGGRVPSSSRGQPPQQQKAPPAATVMGLGLGMGIKMGMDGRFYASMGGVTMPQTDPQQMLLSGHHSLQSSAENNVWQVSSTELPSSSQGAAGTTKQATQLLQTMQQTTVARGEQLKRQSDQQHNQWETSHGIKFAMGATSAAQVSSNITPQQDTYRKVGSDDYVNGRVRSYSQKKKANLKGLQSPPTTSNQLSPPAKKSTHKFESNRNSRVERTSFKGSMDEYQQIYNQVSEKTRTRLHDSSKQQPFQNNADYQTMSPTSNQQHYSQAQQQSRRRSHLRLELDHGENNLPNSKGSAILKEPTFDSNNRSSRIQHLLPPMGDGSSRTVNPQELYQNKSEAVSQSAQLVTHHQQHNVGVGTGSLQLHKKHQRMNSTNDSSFTEQPSRSNQLIVPPNMQITNHQSTINTTNPSNFINIQKLNQPMTLRQLTNNSQTGPTATTDSERISMQDRSPKQTPGSNSDSPIKGSQSHDTKPFILMKHKVEENSKQLKHDIAQQIISASQFRGSNQRTAKHGIKSGQARKSSLIQVAQAQLPPVRSKPDNSRQSQMTPNKLTVQQQDNSQMTLFYRQITGDDIKMGLASLESHPMSQQQPQLQLPSSRLTANPAKTEQDQQLTSAVNRTSMQKHNSMENLLVTKAAARNNVGIKFVQDGSSQQMPKHQMDLQQSVLGGEAPSINSTSLAYRLKTEKRTSQPPLVNRRGNGDDPITKEQKQGMLVQQVDNIKRNSVQSQLPTQRTSFPQSQQQHQLQNYTKETFTNLAAIESHNMKMQTQQQIYENFLTPDNAQWIRRAIELSKKKEADDGDDGTIQQLQPLNMELSQVAAAIPSVKMSNMQAIQAKKQSLAMGSVVLQIPQQQLSPSPVGAQTSISEFQEGAGERGSLQQNVLRARLLLDKKKKQFEQGRDGRWRMTTNAATEAFQVPGGQQSTPQTQQQFITQEQMQQDKFSKAGILVGSRNMQETSSAQANTSFARHQQQQLMMPPNGLICIPNITYKSILPSTQQPQSQNNHNQQMSKMRGMEHPLSNQQLFNGYQKNHAATKMSKPDRRANQERALQQNKGIQGKNISLMQQKQQIQAQTSNLISAVDVNRIGETFSLQTILESYEPGFIEALQENLSPQEFQTLLHLREQYQKTQGSGNSQLTSSSSRKNLVQAMHIAETGGGLLNNQQQQQQQQQQQTPGLFQRGVPQAATGNFVIFNQNGQTFVRNNITNKFFSMDSQLDLSSLELMQPVIDPTQDNAIKSPMSNSQQRSTNASRMADQMVANGIGQRSLSKMVQSAQLSSVLQQIAQHAQVGNINPDQLTNEELVQRLIQVRQQEEQQRSPQSSLHVRGRSDKLSKMKYVSPQKGPMRATGESNGSLSTKPATGTTMGGSSTKVVRDEESKERVVTKKGKKKQDPLKRRVHIFHEQDDTALKGHKINKAINTINNIIRLIFKNNKDSLAITTTNNTSSLNGPPVNRLMEDHRIVELQKIAKQISIQIPRKFDSKLSLREFFYSREFILNVKTKMQNLLHKAILTANNIPQSVIEANMYGNSGLVNGQASKDDKNVYQAKKFHVGTGNNFPIVKSVLKQRYWWQYGAEESFAADCDFIWTSWKKQKHIDFLTNINTKWRQKVSKAAGGAGTTQNLADISQVNSPKAVGTGSTFSVNNINETEQKAVASSGSKIPSKKKRERMAVSQDHHQSGSTTARGGAADQQNGQPNVEKIVFPLRLYNKLQQNKQLTNKKGVFVNMRKYYDSLGQDPFKVLPLTFHTQQGINDPDYRKFAQAFARLEERRKQLEKQEKEAIALYKKDSLTKRKSAADYDENEGSEPDTDDEDAIEKIKRKFRSPQNTWIIKPGENTNRGVGITVVKTLREVQQIIGRPSRKEGDRTFIIQKYIDYPLLVHKRKFDFRCFGLLTSINGTLKGYCYQDGYIRTSCREYSLDDISDPFVHLTNDAIQQKAEEYGKFENGNKISWQDFTKIILAQQPDLDFDFTRDIFPQIQKLIADTFKAAFHKIDPDRLQNTFELFGYDFMIDEDFRLYLIEVNTNPCLEVCCPLMARIIPEVLDNSFKIVLDPLFPSPDLSHNRKFQLNELPQEIKYQLVFDEEVEGEAILANFQRGVKGSIPEEEIESDKEKELEEDDDAY